MPDDNYTEEKMKRFNEDIEIREEDNGATTKEGLLNNNFFDSDFLLLILILFILFWNNDKFSNHFQSLNSNVKTIKNYLDMADTTIQVLDQTTQIPNQMLD